MTCARPLLTVVSRAIEAEHAHAERAIEALIDRTDDALKSQVDERKDAVDAFFESQRDSEEPLRPQKAAEELGALIRLPLRLTGEQSRQLAEDPDDFKKWLGGYVEAADHCASTSAASLALSSTGLVNLWVKRSKLQSGTRRRTRCLPRRAA